MRNTKMRAENDRVPCWDGGDRWTKAKAITEIKTDAIRCQGGGQASLIFFILTQLVIITFFLDLELNAHRTVIGACDIFKDKRRRDGIPQIFTHEEVVDPPAHVSLAGPCLQIPPGVVLALSMKDAQGI
jgi:hypothetical protein